MRQVRSSKVIGRLSRSLSAALLAVAAMESPAGIDRAFLDGLLRVPSRCADEPQLVRAVEFTRSWLTAHGVWSVVETNEVGRVALYAGTVPGKVHDYQFVSHLDVVAAPDGMFTPRYEGDKVFARGACDTKGNAVVMCQVLANLVGKASVGMFLATDEDGGGRGQHNPPMMIERGYLPRKMLIVGDSAGEEPGQLFTAEKGHSRLVLVAHGKGGHASRPWALDNPVPKLCAAYMKFAESWDPGGDPSGTWRTYVSPTMLKGSDAGNAIGDAAEMHFSCRYTLPSEFDRVMRALKATGLEVRGGRGRPPVVNKPGDPEIAALLAAMNAKLPGGIREGRMSAATDASYYADLGLPIVIFAATGGEPHCDREWGSLKSLDDYADFFTDYLGEKAAINRSPAKAADVAGRVLARPGDASYTRVVCDVSSLPQDKRFLADMLSSRIEARTPPSDKGNALHVRFAIDAGVSGENAAIAVRGGRATVTAGRFGGLVRGTGVLLRRIRYGLESFRLEDGDYSFAPKKGLRHMYFCRHFHNWYQYATAEDLTEYIDDLALAGNNGFSCKYDYPTFNRAEASEEDLRKYAFASKKAYERVHALDCGFRVDGGSNQAPASTPEKFRGAPNIDPLRANGGFNVCPEKPGAMEYLMEYRRRQLKELEGVDADYLWYWPFDEGGCNCEKCRPWGGNGFTRLIEKYAPVNKAAFPRAKTIVSTWVFHDDDWEGFYKWLERYDGVDYVLVDSHRDYPRYPLEHPIPKNIPIISFPEISMWGRYYWGAYGATMMPRRFHRLFHQCERIVAGCVVYSEGLYEDVNKEFVTGLYIDPSATVEDLLRTYASYYMPGTDPDDFVRLCDLLEKNHLFPGKSERPDFRNVPEDSPELAEYRRRAEESCRIAEKMQAEILPTCAKSWRWRLVYLRAMIDREIFNGRESCISHKSPFWEKRRKPDSARPYFEEMDVIYKGRPW